MRQHWLVLSDPLEYSVEQFIGQKTVNWEAGLSIPSNNALAKMKKSDTVLFISTGEICEIQGQAEVAGNPFVDSRQLDLRSKYYRPENPELFYNVPLRWRRKFKPIAWSDIQNSKDPNLLDIPHFTRYLSVYNITERQHRAIIGTRSGNIPSCYSPIEQISAPIIREDEITNREVLGSGEYGVVYRAKFRHHIVAAKVLKAQPNELTDEELDKLKIEADILQNIHCPQIIKFFGACISPNSVTIVTELMSRGELGTLLADKNTPLTDFVKLRMALDIAVGMNWLHTSRPHQFIHRDLKTSNLLVDSNYRIKICDFGFCQIKDPSLKKLGPSGMIGTLKYMAPEVLLNKEFSEKIDVYSFGIILWEIMTRNKLFPEFGPSDGVLLKEHVVGGGRPSLDSKYILKDLTKRCWAAKPEERPSFHDIVLELSTKMIEKHISDEAGRKFWKKFYCVDEVEWDRFECLLRLEIQNTYESQLDPLLEAPTAENLQKCSDYQLNEFASRGSVQKRRAVLEARRRYHNPNEVFKLRTELDLELKCLKMLLRVDENHGKVTLDHWGNFLRWFGPLFDHNNHPSFLCRMKLLLQTNYFHGYLTEIEACSRLKEVNQFLLRFSSQPGYFAISYVTSAHKVEHTRIRYDVKASVFRSRHFEENFYSLQAFLGNKNQDCIPVECPEFSSLFGYNASGSGYACSEAPSIFMEEEDF